MRYISDMAIAGRHREMREVERLLDQAAGGHGGVLAITGPRGSGRSELAAAAAREGAQRGFQVLRTAAVQGTSGLLVWARLLCDAGAPEDLASRLLGGDGPLELDAVARALVSQGRRLLVVDDIDHGGPAALRVLTVVTARAAAGSTAVVVTSLLPVGLGTELRLGGLKEDELAAVLPDLEPGIRHGVWLASGGLPGVARSLATELAGTGGDRDPLVHLALTVPSNAEFLDVDFGLVRLLEMALPQAPDTTTRARLLARLARELLGDSAAGQRRRALADEGLKLARDSGEPGVLAEVLDARLHALWDPAGAEDRLAAAAEIIDLARAAGDGIRERDGMFWRFVALMELSRVREAEPALAAFEHAARAAGDGHAIVMATARHAMLACFRGRFEDAARLAGEVAAEGQRVGLPDTERLVGSLHGEIAFYRGTDATYPVDQLRALARRLPGHYMEALAAVWLALTGRTSEARAEMARVLPAVLSGSGPRQLSAAAMLAVVAVQAGDAAATAQLHEALLPYRGRLVVAGGAASCMGPVSLFLGLLATQLGLLDEAVRSLDEATSFAEQAGALPGLVLCLQAAAGALDVRQAAGDREKASAHRAHAQRIAEQLGEPGLLGRLAPVPGRWALRRDGQDWLLEAGPERARLRDSRGMHYLRALLSAPGSEIPALDLAAGGPGLIAPDTAPLLDATARQAYRRRIRELDSELASADRTGDRAAAERASTERQELISELRRATGLAGRPRRATADAERARVNVTRTIRAAIDRITLAAPVAGTHLQSSIRTGTLCRYQPAPGGPASWST